MKVMQVLFKDLPKNTRTPFLTYCRKLIKQGKDPDIRLEVWDNGHLRMFTNNIGHSAKWSVQEDPNLRFVKYRPPSFVNIAGQPTTGTPKDSLKNKNGTNLADDTQNRCTRLLA